MDGQRIGVVTGTAMGRLMEPVLDTVRSETGGAFEILTVPNGLFGERVTTAGLLPGRSVIGRLDGTSFDLVLLPAEALNDDDLFVDDVVLDDLRRAVACPVAPSYDFADVLGADG